MTDFPVPEGIPTSVTLPELRLLQRYAAGRRVLEIGTYLGFTCIGMALADAHVTTYDPHYEGPADKPDTWEPFLNNCRRHHIFSHIRAWRKPIEAYQLPEMDGGFDLAFIDGDHVWPYPMRDAEIARLYLRPWGHLAFHDVTPRWPGVWHTVTTMVEGGSMVKVDQAGTLGVYQCRGFGL